MILVKFHENVVAVCDSDLIGKKLDDGKVCLEITERFYKGDKKSDKEVEDILKEADNVNIVGEKSVKVAIKAGVVSKDEVIEINGVPHAMIFSL